MKKEYVSPEVQVQECEFGTSIIATSGEQPGPDGGGRAKEFEWLDED